MTYRRQKRWWNAYILFYERIDDGDEEVIMKSVQDLSISTFWGFFKGLGVDKCYFLFY